MINNLIKGFNSSHKEDRMILFLLFSTIGNVIIATIKFIFSISIPSLWFGVNAGFSTVLAITRTFTIRDYKKIRKIDNKVAILEIGYENYMRNGVLLVVLGIMYFFVSLYMFYNGTNTTMHEYIVYLVALMAFESIGTSIYGIVKYKKDKNPIILAVKHTNFANALTSIVLTQVVLLDTFGELTDYAKVDGYAGMGVSLIIICLGLYMSLGIKDKM